MSQPAQAAESGHDGHDGHDGHGEHHDVSFYYKTYAALVVLFIVSVVGPYIGEITGIQSITLVTAFGIAVVKAGLVIRNFMHLNVEKAFVHYFLITSIAFMFLFFFAVAPDVMNHEGSRWENVAAKSWIEKQAAYEEANAGHHGGGHGDAHGGGHGDAHGDGHEGGHGADEAHKKDEHAAPEGDGHH